MTAPSDVETLERREPKITAALVRLHLQVMRERYGAAVDQAVEDLEAEVRAELTALLPVQWVRIGTLIDFYEAATRRLSRPVEELHWEVGRECVDRTFRTMWRLLLRVTTDEALIARTPVIYAKTYSVGRFSTHVICAWPCADRAIGVAQYPHLCSPRSLYRHHHGPLARGPS